MTEKPHERKIITDKLLIEKTNRTLEDWFLVLDKKGAQKMNHPEIFALVSKIKGLGPLGEWNQNLLITSYEWSRGIKERGQKENGFEISVSKTVSVPVALLYNRWTDDPQRKKWLKEKIIIRKATENRSVRITWSDNETSLSVDFYPKGNGKSQVVVQHLKIPDSKKATELKEYWSKKLNELKSLLES
jgi:uncharacterized protein YndB with AHSA1/START domain